jgi:hypothetical protein
MMSDGPFKNLKLTAPFKRVVETLDNEAFGDTERSDLFCHANLMELSSAGGMDLVAALYKQADKDQLDLDTMGAVTELIRKQNESSFADKMQQELTYRIHHGASLMDGLDMALPSAIERHLHESNNHIQEELIRAQESGDAKPNQVANALTNLGKAYAAVPVNKICAAVKQGNKNAFKDSVSKKQGEDEGPSL